MAHARLGEIKTVTYDEGVILELTNDEAQMLRDVLAKVAGDYTKSRRRLAKSVSSALVELGFTYDTDDMEGYIRFYDREEG